MSLSEEQIQIKTELYDSWHAHWCIKNRKIAFENQYSKKNYTAVLKSIHI